jgi:flavin-dependent dehydrogenase
MIKNIRIYGAGLSGLIAAINLVREGYGVTLYEKEKKIGGSPEFTPSIHMTPIHIQKMQNYIGIEIDSCFSELNLFKAYIHSKEITFNPKHLYVVERGPRKTSIEYFLYKIALEEGVNFEFSHHLTREEIGTIPENSIIATGEYSKLYNYLNLPRYTSKVFNTHMKTDLGRVTIAYFGSYTSNYGYISSKNGILSAHLPVPFDSSEKDLKKFSNLVKETEGIEFNKWSSTITYFPKRVRLFTKFSGKTFIIAGALSGFIDPFFGFGVNGALISGKIAAMSIVSKQKALEEFKRFAVNLNKSFLLDAFYSHLPFKKLILPQIIKYYNSNLFLIKRGIRSIPGFTDEDWLKIMSIQHRS